MSYSVTEIIVIACARNKVRTFAMHYCLNVHGESSDFTMYM